MVLHGIAMLAGARRVAVLVEPAHPAKISPLLMSAYGLTEREQQVSRLVLQGYSSRPRGTPPSRWTDTFSIRVSPMA